MGVGLSILYVSKHPPFHSERLAFLLSHSNVSSIDITSLGGLLMLGLVRYIVHDLSSTSASFYQPREVKRRQVSGREREERERNSLYDAAVFIV